MVKDARDSRNPRGGSAIWASGDAGTAKDLIDIAAEHNLAITDLTITYDSNATAEATVTLYDEPSGTGSGSLNKVVDEYIVTAGDTIDLTGIARDDVADDLVGLVESNDGDLAISVGGYLITG